MDTQPEIPASPDFTALRRAAERSNAERQELFALIGNLVFAWSNNESMLIYMLTSLLKTDVVTAALVFGTLNTTRARIDLVKRLAKANLRDEALARELAKLLKWFEVGTRIRNEFNHSMFVLDGSGAITHTHALRVEERNGEVRFGTEQPIDAKRLETLRRSIRSMSSLNEAIWNFLPRLDAHLRREKPDAQHQ